MRLLFFLCILAPAVSAYPQSPDPTGLFFNQEVDTRNVDGMFVNWSEGKILLGSGEEFPCQIRFDQINQNMDIRYKGQMLEIPAADISSFNFYDSIKRQDRFFEKVIIPSGKVILMEYLFKAEKTALLEERFISHFHMTFLNPTTLEPTKFRYTKPVEKKFILHRNSGKALVASRSNLMSLLEDKTKQLKAFLLENDLDLKTDEEYIKVLTFYDEL